MDFKTYQKKANSTAIYDSKFSILYPTLGLAGEAGEVAEKVKKIIRDNKQIINEKENIARELGDVLWYIAAIARDIGYELDTIAEMNLEKLADRKARGTIQGNGDNR